ERHQAYHNNLLALGFEVFDVILKLIIFWYIIKLCNLILESNFLLPKIIFARQVRRSLSSAFWYVIFVVTLNSFLNSLLEIATYLPSSNIHTPFLESKGIPPTASPIVLSHMLYSTSGRVFWSTNHQLTNMS
ncbi:hypothetical protein ACJX0J_026048, partial [Zea mays]